jgi:hypothetical protein
MSQNLLSKVAAFNNRYRDINEQSTPITSASEQNIVYRTETGDLLRAGSVEYNSAFNQGARLVARSLTLEGGRQYRELHPAAFTHLPTTEVQQDFTWMTISLVELKRQATLAIYIAKSDQTAGVSLGVNRLGNISSNLIPPWLEVRPVVINNLLDQILFGA